MALSRLERTRSERDREFQTRVLGALEKPQGSRLAAFVNAPFFMWCMTTAFLTIGGATLTSYQQCVKDADQLGEKFSRLGFEIVSRKAAVMDILAQEQSLLETTAALKRTPSASNDFQAQSLLALISDYATLARKIELPKDYTQVAFPNDPQILSEISKNRFTMINYGLLPEGLTERQLPSLREFAKRWFKGNGLAGAVHLRTTYAPACTLPNLFRTSVLGERPQIVRAEVQPPNQAQIDLERSLQ